MIWFALTLLAIAIIRELDEWIRREIYLEWCAEHARRNAMIDRDVALWRARQARDAFNGSAAD